MEDVLDIAFYLYGKYQRTVCRSLDEMKLHKLLYFSQRESLVRSGEPLFEENFEGWKFGPVCVPIRSLYRKKEFEKEDHFAHVKEKLSEKSRDIVDTVIEAYGKKDSWSLSDITHAEYSWQQSRIGVKEGENGNKVILLDDIRIDAERIRKRREKLKGVKTDYLPVNTASYLPVINEEDILSQTEESVSVTKKIEEIYELQR